MTEQEVITYNFCPVIELRQKGFITKWVEELRDEITAIYNDGVIRVVSSVCPHFGGEFKINPKTRELRCSWHDWCFNADSGACTNRNVKTKLRHYDFREENGNLVVIAE